MKKKSEEFPPSLQRFIKKYTEVWGNYEKLGVACNNAGPLKEKCLLLIKMAINGAQGLETPLKTHARKALKAGVTPEEIRHALIQLLPATGIASMMRALRWAEQVIGKKMGM